MKGQGRASNKTRRNVLIVGVKLNSSSRELLTWTLAKFANSGDHVIALHIASSPSESDALKNKSDDVIQHVDDVFDSVLGVYEGFCSIKQIDLQVKVLHGPSPKKLLVEAARNYNAAKLILGTSSKQVPLGSSFSLAKYCSLRLPFTCSILVIQHGRAVFKKDGTLTYPGDKVLNRIQRTVRSHSCNGPGQQRPSDLQNRGGFFQCDCGDFEKSTCNWPVPTRLIDSPSSTPHAYKHVPPQVRQPNNIPISPSRVWYQKDTRTFGPNNAGLKGFHSLYESSTDCSDQKKVTEQLPVPDSAFGSRGSADLGQKFTLGSLENSSKDTEAGNQLVTESATRPWDTFKGSTHPGWPLLNRSISMAQLKNPRVKSRKMSVLEWTLQLPDRTNEVLKETAEVAKDLQPHYCPSVNNGGMGSNFMNRLEQQRIEDEGREVTSTKFNAKADQLCYKKRDASATKRTHAVHQNKPCIVFRFAELQAATNNFSAGNLVGKGGCSQVYQGVLSDGCVVAVKCLNKSTPESEEEFITEVEIISGLQHCHIIQLIGYCVEGHHFLLVFNFASEGNLEQKLHAGKGEAALSWDIRYNVAVGVAAALDYLHDGCARPVIHRDVKSSNILLTSDLKPQLTDFGLAKWAPTAAPHITCSDVVGTFGYLAPEYFMYGKVSEKTDVYSFGVVLLELITGKRPIDTAKPKGQENLIAWARPLLEDESSSDQLIDPKLEGTYNVGQLKNMVIAAALCLRQSPHSRPRMARILKLLIGECEDLEHFVRHNPICKESDEGYDTPNYGDCDIRTHLALALLGVDDDVASQTSIDHSVDFAHSTKFLEEYFGNRYGRSSSFE